MHRSSFALASTRSFSKKFSHHGLNFNALGDTVPVSAVSAGHIIIISQVRAHSHRDCFLTYVEMNKTLDPRSCKLFLYSLFKSPDREQPLKHVQELLIALN